MSVHNVPMPTYDRWNHNGSDILKAIQDNPDLPVYFAVSEEITDNRWTLHCDHQVQVCDMTYWNESIYTNKEEAIEEIHDYYYSPDDPESLQEIADEVSSLKFEKCILIFTTP